MVMNLLVYKSRNNFLTSWAIEKLIYVSSEALHHEVTKLCQ